MFLKLRKNVFKIGMILAILTSSLFLGVNSSKATTTKTGEVTATSLYMRKGPSTAYSKVMTLKKGYKLSIIESKNGWYRIKYSNKAGWASGAYIKVVKSTSSAPKVLFAGETTASSLNVRTSSSTASKVLTTLKKGTKISVLEKKGTWYRIKTSKGDGWVSSKYVKKTVAAKPSEENIVKPPTSEPPSEDTSTPSSQDKMGIVTTSALNVRTGPSTTFESINTLTSGTVVSIKAEKDGWYQIEVGAITGWVSAKYIQQDNEDMKLENFILVIDPGHGGSDPGATFKTSNGDVYKESMIVLKVSQFLKSYLLELPIQTYFTRETDVYPTLSQRVTFAKTKKANAFISIHTNATSSHSGNGTETYYYGETKNSSTISPTKLEDSMTLADTIQNRLVEKLELKDRGTKSGNFQVVRESTMASILTELGFIDHPADNIKLSDAIWQQEAAKGIYLGILDYLSVQGYNVDSYYLY